MDTPIIMPQLGESVVEGTVAEWLKRPGDPIEEYESVVRVSTDKVDTEIPAPAKGVLREILVPEGATVNAGVTLAWIATEQVGALERAARHRSCQTCSIRQLCPAPTPLEQQPPHHACRGADGA
jgi:pyruvate/2-oxoglutarate dehydrogenase complex dihydrolipoamide acyltransferase (E2) component